MAEEITVEHLGKHLNRRVFSKLALFLLVLFANPTQEVGAAVLPEEAESIAEEKSTWQLMREKLRVRTFTEFMSPAANSNGPYVPDLDGSQLMPTNAYTIAWADYEIAKDIKILYWQRFFLNFASTSSAEGMNIVLRNPRFAIRKVNVFNIPNLSTTYDLYIQPGVASVAVTANRNIVAGLRTNNSYTFPGSRWTIGNIMENTFSFSNPPEMTGATSYGWTATWVSYDINKVFSTQTYFTLNYLHNRGTSGLQWDTPLPYIQNGISMNVTNKIWASVFLNNYVQALPTLSNTWASLWLATNIF